MGSLQITGNRERIGVLLIGHDQHEAARLKSVPHPQAAFDVHHVPHAGAVSSQPHHRTADAAVLFENPAELLTPAALIELRQTIPDSFLLLVTAGASPPQWLARAHADEWVGNQHLNSPTLACMLWHGVRSRRLARTLADTQQRTDRLLEQATDMIYLHDLPGNICDTNGRTCQTLGYSREELLRLNVRDVTCDFREVCYAEICERVAKGAVQTMEGLYRCKDGATLPVELRVGQIKMAGQPLLLVVARDITARRQAEQERQRESHLLRTLVDSLPDRVYMKDAEGRYLISNQAHARWLGARPEQVVGRTPFDFLERSFAQRLTDRDLAALRSRQSLTDAKVQLRAPDGRVDWVWHRKVPVLDAEGRPLGVLGVTTAITERVTAEEQRERLIAGLRAVLESANALLASPDDNALYRQAVEFAQNRLGCERCGLCRVADGRCRGTFGVDARGQIVDTAGHDCPVPPLPPADQLWSVAERPLIDWRDGAEHVIGHGWVALTPVRLAGADLGLFWNDTALSHKPLDPVQQEILAVFASLLANALEQRRAEAELQRERDLLRTVVDNLPERIFAKDDTGRFVLNNAAHWQALGAHSAADVAGRTDADFFAAAAAETFSAAERRVMASGQPVLNEEVLRVSREGHRSWVSVSRVPWRDRAGNIVGTVGISRDVTVEHDARDQERRFLAGLRAVLEVADDLLLAAEEDELLRLAVESGREKLGLERCGILLREGTSLRGAFGTNARRQTVDEHAVLISRKDRPWLDEVERLDPRQQRWLLVNVEQTEWRDGRFERVGEGPVVVTPIRVGERFLGVFINDTAITRQPLDPIRQEVVSVFCSLVGATLERKRLERRMLDGRKLEAVGRLAGGVAHEFNNILTGILGHHDRLLGSLMASDPRREHVNQIGASARRAAELTRQLLAYGRRQMLAPQVVDLNELVRHAAGLFAVRPAITVAVHLHPQPCCATVDGSQFEQVILNLTINAVEAMPHGGQLTLATAVEELASPLEERHGILPAGRYAVVTVTDTGTGMAEETLSHLFEPFFTTKDRTQGDGLGLAMSYGIVQQSGGHISATSEWGKGATFRIYVPVAESAPANRCPTRTANPLAEPPAAPTVLLADDEPCLRELAAAALAEAGYQVLAAADGKEALFLAQQHNGPIHLLVTDVMMPNMDGSQLAEQLAVLRPDTRVLFISGYADAGVVRNGVVATGVVLLPKPFTMKALTQKVRDLVNS